MSHLLGDNLLQQLAMSHMLVLVCNHTQNLSEKKFFSFGREKGERRKEKGERRRRKEKGEGERRKEKEKGEKRREKREERREKRKRRERRKMRNKTSFKRRR